jgi:hypothetical protein
MAPVKNSSGFGRSFGRFFRTLFGLAGVFGACFLLLDDLFGEATTTVSRYSFSSAASSMKPKHHHQNSGFHVPLRLRCGHVRELCPVSKHRLHLVCFLTLGDGTTGCVNKTPLLAEL